MHRYRREARVDEIRLPSRLERAATFAGLVELALLAAGAGLWAIGVLPSALTGLAVPLLVMMAITQVIVSLAQGAGTLSQGRPLRYSRAAFTLGMAAILAGNIGRAAGFWGLDGAFMSMVAAAAVGGTALLVDAVRDARRPVYPRLAVISSALGGTGILMIAATMLSAGDGAVWNRVFLMGAALLGAAAFGVLRLRRIHRSRQEMLARMGLGDR